MLLQNKESTHLHARALIGGRNTGTTEEAELIPIKRPTYSGQHKQSGPVALEAVLGQRTRGQDCWDLLGTKLRCSTRVQGSCAKDGRPRKAAQWGECHTDKLPVTAYGTGLGSYRTVERTRFSAHSRLPGEEGGWGKGQGCRHSGEAPHGQVSGSGM